MQAKTTKTVTCTATAISCTDYQLPRHALGAQSAWAASRWALIVSFQACIELLHSFDSFDSVKGEYVLQPH